MREGTVLTRQDIRTLADAGVRRIRVVRVDGPVVDAGAARPGAKPAPVVEPPTASPVSEEVRKEARRAIEQYIGRLKAREAADLDDIESAVVKVLDQVLNNSRLLARFGQLRLESDIVFDHSVGVCVLSVIIGLELEYDYVDLKALATGAILHDVGKVYIPDEIWNLPRKLTEEEFEQVRKHTVLGFEVLRKHRDLDIRSAHVAYQHHERLDGKGYPRGLSGNEIHRFARIVSVADVYDAVTSPRPYRDALPAHRAVQIIAEERGKAFDPAVVGAFLRRIGRRVTSGR